MTIHYITDLSSVPEDTLAVIDFFAKWCSPCRFFEPKFEELSKQLPHVFFCKVDVDDSNSKSFIEQFEITAMPTFVFLKNGQVLHKVFGADEKEVRQALSRFSL